MIKVISQLYYFSHMWKKVQSYVNKCDLCYKINSSRYKSYEEMRTASTLYWSWASITINFIIKLSFLKKLLIKVIFNLILMIVNQLMKKVRFLSYKEVSDAEELTYTFLQNVTAVMIMSSLISNQRWSHIYAISHLRESAVFSLLSRLIWVQIIID